MAAIFSSGRWINAFAWWRHQMETFSALLALCAGNSLGPVNSPHKGQWRGALMFSLICARINDWVNNREAGDPSRYRGHYDVIVMKYWVPVGFIFWYLCLKCVVVAWRITPLVIILVTSCLYFSALEKSAQNHTLEWQKRNMNRLATSTMTASWQGNTSHITDPLWDPSPVGSSQKETLMRVQFCDGLSIVNLNILLRKCQVAGELRQLNARVTSL